MIVGYYFEASARVPATQRDAPGQCAGAGGGHLRHRQEFESPELAYPSTTDEVQRNGQAAPTIALEYAWR